MLSPEELKELTPEERREYYRQERLERAKRAVAVFAEYSNDMNASEEEYREAIDALGDALDDEHRTLQQKIFGVFLGCIWHWGGLRPGEYDPRNEYTVEMSRKIREALKKEMGDRYYRPPFI